MSSTLLSLLEAQNKDIGAASQTFLTEAKFCGRSDHRETNVKCQTFVARSSSL